MSAVQVERDPELEAPATPDEPVTAEVFRATMAGVPTPVCVVTVLDAQHPHGTTVSAFASLSASPPMVTIALDAGSGLLRRLHVGSGFGINVLTAEQAGQALVFAGKGDRKFDGIEWRLDGGAPRLAGPGGWLRCEATDLVTGGDHVIVLGTVIAAEPAAHEARPLTYHRRAFGTHQPHLG